MRISRSFLLLSGIIILAAGILLFGMSAADEYRADKAVSREMEQIRRSIEKTETETGPDASASDAVPGKAPGSCVEETVSDAEDGIFPDATEGGLFPDTTECGTARIAEDFIPEREKQPPWLTGEIFPENETSAQEILPAEHSSVQGNLPAEHSSAQGNLPAEQSSLQDNFPEEHSSADYLGYLTIPSLGLELPVWNEWSEGRMKTAPCRQFGNKETDDLVIAGHNYKAHFAKLKTLVPGDSLSITDMDASVVNYEVKKTEIVDPAEAAYVKDSGYDLVLYTCTPGGKQRQVIFCDRVCAV